MYVIVSRMLVLWKTRRSCLFVNPPIPIENTRNIQRKCDCHWSFLRLESSKDILLCLLFSFNYMMIDENLFNKCNCKVITKQLSSVWLVDFLLLLIEESVIDNTHVWNNNADVSSKQKKSYSMHRICRISFYLFIECEFTLFLVLCVIWINIAPKNKQAYC